MNTDLLNLPALSIRQPWAWLILNGGKDVENRTWKTNFRGRFLIHAAKGMTREEFEAACEFSRLAGFRGDIPDGEQLARGGIVGVAELVDCTMQHRTPWFCGPYGFMLRNVAPVPFIPCKGSLGFFVPTLPR